MTTSPAAVSPAAASTAHEAAQLRRRRVVLTVLALLAAASVVGYLTVDVVGSWTFVLKLRSTQVAALVLVGTAIAYSTVLFQTVTGNRILTPSVMGFDSLFVLIQTVIVFLFGADMLAQTDARLKFGFEIAVMVAFSVLLFRLLFRRGSHDLYVMVLVGIVLGTLFSGLSTFVSRLIDPNEYLTLQDVMFASFNSVNEELLAVSAVLVVAVMAYGVRLLRRLDVVALGRDHAVNLGVNHRSVVNQALVAVALLVSVSTALVGPITFLGLLVANLARQLTRTFVHRWTIPAAALVAVIALVGGQLVLARMFDFTTSLSVIINFVGGSYFILLLLRESRS
ncbi:iron chelate uptake ABC transporter family permease subunit [Thermobifida halotolerans]|uniref:Iron chelate uptake ABC transporter family permease subunit n=1 Tax=Thermobifida halotolerans TaxID=483545 RepID=A0AA97M626_9ACTN|nr:iron chelate uptake ABC transporter family permease subunit [Thermobifida halotolerans]UOE21715.1 iron chelate uptake ABC transporter family permease subunit [Thermobifida halotolerans]